MGTRFIATKECIAHANYKNTIVESLETGTALVNMGRFQVRALHTPLVGKILEDDAPSSSAFAGPAVEESWIQGDLSAGLLPAGQVSGLISGIPSAQEVIQEMVGHNRE